MATDRVSFYDESLKKQIEGSFVSDGKSIHVRSAYGNKSVPYSDLGACIDHNSQVLLAQKLLSELARDPGSGKFKDLHQQKDDQQLEPMQKPFVGGASGAGVVELILERGRGTDIHTSRVNQPHARTIAPRQNALCDGGNNGNQAASVCLRVVRPHSANCATSRTSLSSNMLRLAVTSSALRGRVMTGNNGVFVRITGRAETFCGAVSSPRASATARGMRSWSGATQRSLAGRGLWRRAVGFCVGHLAQRKIFGKSSRREIFGGTTEQSMKRTTRRIRTDRTAGKIDRYIGTPE